jgi:hypothetical protein
MKGFFSSLIGWFEENHATQPDDTDLLETILTRQLAPVAPRQTYIDSLGKRLSDRSQQVVIHEPAREIDVWVKTLVLIAGVISGILLIAYLRRTSKLSASSLGSGEAIP